MTSAICANDRCGAEHNVEQIAECSKVHVKTEKLAESGHPKTKPPAPPKKKKNANTK